MPLSQEIDPRGMASGYHNPTLQRQGISLRLPQLQRDNTTVGSRKSILACSVGENSASVTCASKTTTEWVHAWSLYMILTLNLIAQRRREFGRPTYAAYVDLRSAFDSISQPAFWLLLSRLGIPGKIINLMKSLYDQSVRWPNSMHESSFLYDCSKSEWFEITSGVRQGALLHRTRLLLAWIGS